MVMPVLGVVCPTQYLTNSDDVTKVLFIVDHNAGTCSHSSGYNDDDDDDDGGMPCILLN